MRKCFDLFVVKDRVGFDVSGEMIDILVDCLDILSVNDVGFVEIEDIFWLKIVVVVWDVIKNDK